MESCLPCNDFLSCKNTEYQRDWYPFVVENCNRVEEVGFRKYLEEEEEKAKAGIDLMDHLERRCCKVVKLESTWLFDNQDPRSTEIREIRKEICAIWTTGLSWKGSIDD